jgi:hypothetical protein
VTDERWAEEAADRIMEKAAPVLESAWARRAKAYGVSGEELWYYNLTRIKLREAELSFLLEEVIAAAKRYDDEEHPA